MKSCNLSVPVCRLDLKFRNKRWCLKTINWGKNPGKSCVSEWMNDVWPCMVTHTWNLCSEFNPSKCTHTVVNTHTTWTHTRSSGQSQRPETRTHSLQVTGPTLYTLGHDCPTGAGVWYIPSFSEHCTSVDFPWSVGSKIFKEKCNGNSQTYTIKWVH